MKKGFLFIVGVLVIGSTVIWKGIDSKVFTTASKESTEVVASKVAKQTIGGLSTSIRKHFDELSFILKENKNSVEIYNKEGSLLGVLRGNQITSTPGFTTKTFNSLLDAKLLPNFIYKVEGVIFKTDALSRVKEVTVSSFPKSLIKKPRSPKRQGLGKLYKDAIQGVDVGGHAIANRLGGISEVINMFPMNKVLNGKGGKWYRQEEFIANNKQFIKDLKIKFTYTNNSFRPDYFQLRYKFKNKDIVESFVNSSTL